MTNSQPYFVEDGPSVKRLITLAFFRWKIQRNDKGTVTFTIKGGQKICVNVLYVVICNGAGVEGWVELMLLDKKATLGAERLRCLYNHSTRSGAMSPEWLEMTTTSVQAMH